MGSSAVALTVERNVRQRVLHVHREYARANTYVCIEYVGDMFARRRFAFVCTSSTRWHTEGVFLCVCVDEEIVAVVERSPITPYFWSCSRVGWRARLRLSLHVFDNKTTTIGGGGYSPIHIVRCVCTFNYRFSLSFAQCVRCFLIMRHAKYSQTHRTCTRCLCNYIIPEMFTR